MIQLSSIFIQILQSFSNAEVEHTPNGTPRVYVQKASLWLCCSATWARAPSPREICGGLTSESKMRHLKLSDAPRHSALRNQFSLANSEPRVGLVMKNGLHDAHSWVCWKGQTKKRWLESRLLV